MNTPRMMNQSILSTPRFLCIPTIQLIFLNCFHIFLILYATPRSLPPLPGTKHKKGPPAENDRRPRRKTRGPTFPANRQTRRAAPAAPAFPGLSRRGTAGATAGG